ncbi:hypothetical protein GcM1_191010 [Golovinomyces cichoracearum]|uniref:Uncharacterized protein n=1 Tax=Golovinomyces cichoracearum TaxID=62708 RepID=A0A420J1F4_9PEZI|nr:hypothetical protein GcM1_191010 [Golovinomyces cichoracearum]
MAGLLFTHRANCGRVLSDLSERSPVSSGISAQTIRTSLEEPARTGYHETDRSSTASNQAATVLLNIITPNPPLWTEKSNFNLVRLEVLEMETVNAKMMVVVISP